MEISGSSPKRGCLYSLGVFSCEGESSSVEGREFIVHHGSGSKERVDPKNGLLLRILGPSARSTTVMEKLEEKDVKKGWAERDKEDVKRRKEE